MDVLFRYRPVWQGRNVCSKARRILFKITKNLIDKFIRITIKHKRIKSYHSSLFFQIIIIYLSVKSYQNEE